MSSDEKPEPDQGSTAVPRRQPVFLLPLAVTALCGLLLAIQAADTLVLNDQGRELVLTWFAFVPYRLIDPESVPGGWLPLIWTPFTHAFLHGGWQHVIFNSVWLAVFATPVAQRYGAPRMLILFLVGAFVGAAAFAATTLPQVQILVGASGGIAALTGAAVRFIFQPPVVGIDPETGDRVLLGRRLATLGEFVRNPTARFFSLVWIVLNGIVPLLPMLMGTAAVEVAWQAHLGGFLAGVLLVPLLERRQG
jgi:membrane associated rhomboid family serine protease